MKGLLWITLIVALVVMVGTPAMAQDYRSSAMGQTGVGLADGPDAIGYNPAGLPFMAWNGQNGYSGEWVGALSGLVSVDIDSGTQGDDPSRYGLFYAGRQTDMSWGAGALWSHMEFDSSDSDLFGAGFGMALDDEREFSLGVAAFFETIGSSMTVEQNGDNDFTSFDIGGMWRTVDPSGNTWRVGVVATDVSEEYGNLYWRAGASVQTPEALILALDLFDVTDEFDSHVNFGAEYLLEVDSAVIPLRAGLLDGDLTCGAGYRMTNWEVGVSYQDLDGWQELSIGATGWF